MLAYLGMEANTFSTHAQRVLKDLAYRYPNGTFEIMTDDPQGDIKFKFTVLGVHFEMDLYDWEHLHRVRYFFKRVSGAYEPDLNNFPYSTTGGVGDIMDSFFDLKTDQTDRYESGFNNIEKFVNYCLYAG